MRAAERLGFALEGTWRNVGLQQRRGWTVSRSTTYLSILDYEWPAVDQALRGWLARGNFDADGNQLTSLSDVTASIRPPTKARL